MNIEEIKDFANKITPPNWNFYSEYTDYEFEPGTLNIIISKVYDEDELDQDEPYGSITGMKLKKSQRAEIEMKMYIPIESVIIHELAHIGVLRHIAQKLGRKYRQESVIVLHDDMEKEEHGLLFQKALNRMIIRAEKIYGEEIKEKTKTNWAEILELKSDIY